MFSKLEEVESHFSEVGMRLQDPEVTHNQKVYKALMKEFADLEPIVEKYRTLKKVQKEMESSQELLEKERDEELRLLAKEELATLQESVGTLENELKLLLLPKDPNDERDVIIEIRAGAGGDEASLFAEQLFRAYCHYADTRGWKVRILSFSEGNVGGAKEVIGSISGEKVFSRMKFESGVHRVQRVPKTETQGRVHTSTVTVAILPEPDEVEVKIDPNDVRVDYQRSSGHGGQSVNTTDSAVRITHIPSGLVVICQDGKSQQSNKEQALKVLFARLQAIEEEKVQKDASQARLAQIGTGDRSERIRTYNFPQSRITDHRIGLTIHSLNEVMGGSFDELIDPLMAHFQSEALKKETRGHS